MHGLSNSTPSSQIRISVYSFVVFKSKTKMVGDIIMVAVLVILIMSYYHPQQTEFAQLSWKFIFLSTDFLSTLA